MASWSYASCTVPTPRSANLVAVWPVRCSIGVAANRASTRLPTAFAAPGPVLLKNAPSLPVTRA